MTIFTTEIHVRAFNSDFVIELEKEYFISIEQAVAWAIVEMIDTAMVLKVVQKWTEGDLVIFNEKLPGLITQELSKEKMHYRGVVKPVTHEQMQELFNKPKITQQTHA